MQRNVPQLLIVICNAFLHYIDEKMTRSVPQSVVDEYNKIVFPMHTFGDEVRKAVRKLGFHSINVNVNCKHEYQYYINLLGAVYVANELDKQGAFESVPLTWDRDDYEHEVFVASDEDLADIGKCFEGGDNGNASVIACKELIYAINRDENRDAINKLMVIAFRTVMTQLPPPYKKQMAHLAHFHANLFPQEYETDMYNAITCTHHGPLFASLERLIRVNECNRCYMHCGCLEELYQVVLATIYKFICSDPESILMVHRDILKEKIASIVDGTDFIAVFKVLGEIVHDAETERRVKLETPEETIARCDKRDSLVPQLLNKCARIQEQCSQPLSSRTIYFQCLIPPSIPFPVRVRVRPPIDIPMSLQSLPQSSLTEHKLNVLMKALVRRSTILLYTDATYRIYLDNDCQVRPCIRKCVHE